MLLINRNLTRGREKEEEQDYGGVSDIARSGPESCLHGAVTPTPAEAAAAAREIANTAPLFSISTLGTSKVTSIWIMEGCQKLMNTSK